MRITNGIMMNNSLNNINKNKLLMDKLNTQIASTKKLSRPSDDPIAAIRALRLRSTEAELTQYLEKNIEDAEAWMKTTEGALTNLQDVLTKIDAYYNQGVSEYSTVSDRETIITTLKQFKSQLYKDGDADNAGRTIFTGYRTDSTLTFQHADPTKQYEITQNLTLANVRQINKVVGVNTSSTTDYRETDVTNDKLNIVMLAYNNLDSATNLKITSTTNNILNNASVTVKSYQEMGEEVYNIQNDEIVFVPETGEVLFSDKAYETMNTAAGAISGSETEIRMNYKKSKWEVGDLRPEHYFACEGTTTKNGVTKTVSYNEEYLEGKKEKQSIEYDVGYNQKIEVNTTADEVFSHRLDRDVDDLVTALASLEKIESTWTDLKKVLSGLDEGTADYKEVQTKLEAADKAFSYIRENIHDLMQHTITSTQQYLDDTNVAITDNGTRESRLDLISNRLMDQQTTFKTLQSENEDVDIADVTIQLTSTKLTYDAALMATGKIMQTSLMNYI